MAMKQIFAASAVGLSVALTGCVATAGNSVEPDECGASALQNRVGEPVTGTTPEDLHVGGDRVTTAQLVRVVQPGQPVTEDFRPDRLTIEVDEDGNLLTARCV